MYILKEWSDPLSFYDKHIEIYLNVHKSKCLFENIYCLSVCFRMEGEQIILKGISWNFPPTLLQYCQVLWIRLIPLLREVGDGSSYLMVGPLSRICLHKASATWAGYKHRVKVPTVDLADFSNIQKLFWIGLFFYQKKLLLLWNKDLNLSLASRTICTSYSPTGQSKLVILSKVLESMKLKAWETFRNGNVWGLVDLGPWMLCWWTKAALISWLAEYAYWREVVANGLERV